MSRSDQRGLKVLLVVIAVAVAGLIASMMEKTEISIPVGASGQALVNDWYAVELFLEGRGVPVESVTRIQELPPVDHAILLFARGQTQPQIERLEAWVRAGGHLVAVIDPVAVEEWLEEADEDNPSASVPVEDPLAALAGVSAVSALRSTVEPLSLQPPQGSPSLEVDAPERWFFLLQGWMLLWPTFTELAPGAYGTTLAPYARAAWDQGWVTLLPSTRPFENTRVGERDHAAFLWALLQRNGPPAGVTLVYRHQPPSLWALLGRHGWMVLVSGAALLALWLWSALPRFGPLLPDPPPARRSLLEHVIATGEYLWRHGHHGLLLKSARRSVLRQALGNQAPAHGLAVIEAVSAETGLEPELVRIALYGGGSDDPDSFFQAVAALERVRRGQPKPPAEG